MTKENKVRLRRMMLMALDRFPRGEAFTEEEVDAYFKVLRKTRGKSEATDFRNFVWNLLKKQGLEKKLKDSPYPFGRAVVVAIVVTHPYTSLMRTIEERSLYDSMFRTEKEKDK